MKRRTKKRFPLFYYFYIPLIFLFFYAPIIIIIIFSFNEETSLTRWTNFSLVWYKELFQNRMIMDAVQTTLTVAILATVISTIIGTLGAIGIANFKKKRTINTILSINNLPLVTPDIVTAISLSVLFSGIQLPLGYGTMLLAHIAFCTPYVIISVYPRFIHMDKNTIEAAMDLGATHWTALTKVIIPELLPSILSGAIMAFTMSFDDFIISYFVGGNTLNISTYIYAAFRKPNPMVNALMTIIFLVLAVLVFISVTLRFRSEKHNDKKITKKATI